MQGIAALAGSTEPQYVEVPEPAAPGAGEVLCRTLELGVCGTDREILHSARPGVPRGERFLILGHECLARIEAIGPGTEGTSLAGPVQVGDLVVPVVRRARPGVRRRVDMLAFGQFTERGIFFEHGFSTPWWLDRPQYLLPVPRALAPVAVLTEPVAVAEKGINEALVLERARLEADVWSAAEPPRVLVTGQGPIGFAAVLASMARGWPTTMWGRDEAESRRSRLAVVLGARYVTGVAALAPADVQQEGYDLILECTGSDAVVEQAAEALGPAGVMVWLGSSRVPQARMLNLARVMRAGVIGNHLHVGSVNAAPRDFRDALAHLGAAYAERPEVVAQLVTERLAPGEALWHYAHRTPQGIKAVLVYG